MLASDDEIYTTEFATCGAQTPEARREMAEHALALHRDLERGKLGRDKRGPKPRHDHPWIQQGRAMVEEGRARGRVGR